MDTRAAAESLAQALRATRLAAIVGGEPATFRIDLAQQSVRSGAGAVTRVSPSVRLSYLTEAGVTIAAGRAAITFAADGSSSGGTLTVSSQAVRNAVAVDPFTGRVEVLGGG